jgi:hypothetical protein
MQYLNEVEAIGVHDLGPGGDEVVDELLLIVVLRIDLGIGAQDRVRAEHQIHACRRPLDLAGLAVADLVEVVASRLPALGHVRQVDEEVVGQRALAIGEDAVLGAAVVGAQHAHAADQHRHLGAVSPISWVRSSIISSALTT